MAVGFGDPDIDGVLFAVYPDDDGFLPAPSAGAGNNPRTYQATVRVTAAADVQALEALRSVITIMPAIGFASGGTIVVEAGVGTRDLTYPRANGGETTLSAILTDLAFVGQMTSEDRRVDLTFVFVE